MLAIWLSYEWESEEWWVLEDRGISKYVILFTGDCKFEKKRIHTELSIFNSLIGMEFIC